MKLQTARKVMFAFACIGLVAWLVGKGNGIYLLRVGGLGFLAASLLINLLFLRCPACRRYLGRDEGEYCPHCGHRLD